MHTSALIDDRDARSDVHHVSGDPNGLAFDAHTDTLFAADARSGVIWAVDNGRQVRVARIESAGVVSTQRISGLAATPYGSLFVSRLGHGRAGAVFRIDPDGQAQELPGIDPKFWRLGLHYNAREHVLYSTQFLKSRSGPFEGSVVEIDLSDGYVSTIASGFAKPVGVTRVGDALIVIDASRQSVFRVDLVHGRAVTCRLLTDRLGRPDSLCAFDDRSVLVTAFDRETHVGSLHRVSLDGTTELIEVGAWEPRGVAHDGSNAYVATRRTGTILIIPLR